MRRSVILALVSGAVFYAALALGLYFIFRSEPYSSANELQEWSKNQDGKIALITGTSSGIGSALAIEAAKRKITVILVDIRPQGSKDLLEKIKADGGKGIFIQADLSKPKDRDRVVSEALSAYGGVDFLFNNAAYGYMERTENLSLDKAHHQFEVNFWAYVDFVRQLVPQLRKRGGGYIVNIASIVGVHPEVLPGNSAMYVASKHAIIGWSKILVHELEGSNIRVLVVNPAGVRTKFYEHMEGSGADFIRKFVSKPWPFFNTPEDIAEDTFRALPKSKLLLFPGQANLMRYATGIKCMLFQADCL